ncbi:MAG TPA: glycosyltransferase family 4 protein [Bryobacteraceae bacterium]|nr:glycosyltransferase family 4 protein [Bryobacteraceae bacterium]
MAKTCPVLLMTRSLGLGGTERQLTEIAKALAGSEFEPHVGCFDADGFRARELEASGVPIVKFPVRSFLRPGLLAGAIALGRYVKEHAIQIVHTFDVPLNLFGVPAARLYRAPHVISSQRAFRALTPGLRRRMLRFTDQLVDAIVVNSEAVGRDLIETDHVPPRLIHLCYNGIDSSLFHADGRSFKGPAVIGVISALRPEKSIETLIEAFGQLGPRTDVHLRIIGSGSALAALQALAAPLNLGDRCRFEPATVSVADALREIDIFVLPSASESFSNSLMEAMACGCCAVASRVGGNSELIADRETGLLFSAGATGELAACLDLLLRDGELRRRLAVAGNRRIHDRFTIARSAGVMEEIYRNVLAG